MFHFHHPSSHIYFKKIEQKQYIDNEIYDINDHLHAQVFSLIICFDYFTNKIIMYLFSDQFNVVYYNLCYAMYSYIVKN